MARSKNTKKLWLRYVLAPIALLVLLYLIYKQLLARGDLQSQWLELKTHLTVSNLPWFLLVLIMAPLNWSLEALKWQKLLSRIRPVSFGRAFKSMLAGMSLSLVTPNRVGDFAGRIIHVAPGYKVKAAVSSMIGSVAQMCVTAFFGLLGLIYYNFYFGTIYTQIALVVACIIASGLIFLYLNVNRFRGFGKKYKLLRKLNFGLRVLSFYSQKDLLQILSLAFGRFLIFNTQFLILTNVLGADISFYPGILLSALMFWTIAVVPSVAMLELGVRGFVGIFLFVETGITAVPLAIIGGSYLLWCINLVFPAVLGSFTILTVRNKV